MQQKEIAIIGIACRFPEAKNYQEYWNNLIQGESCIKEIPKSRWSWEKYWGNPYTEINKTNSKWGGFIEDIDAFDAPFFNVSSKEAKSMDPQQRIMLELVWGCFEDAGVLPSSLAKKNIGVFIGNSHGDYKDLSRQQCIVIQPHYSTGTAQPAIIPNRISHYFNFYGPSLYIDSACASSLNAVHLAVQSIHNGECEAALAGGINLMLTPDMYLTYSATGMLSPTGSCKTFDARADGYVRSEGAGLILLKPLEKAIEDKDHIYGVIKGSAVSHAGSGTTITTPNAKAQARTIQQAQQNAGVTPESIQFFQTHGTGTPVGDPIEIEGLKQAWGKISSTVHQEAYCGLSSVKSIIGHTEAASGIAGLIASLLSFKYNQVPGLANFQNTNPNIDLTGSPFYIIKKTQPWISPLLNGGDVPRRAGVSAFGFGGVNSHVILEEYIQCNPKKPRITANNKKSLLVISAMDNESLNRRARDLILFLENTDQDKLPDFNDIIFSLYYGRELMSHALAFFVNSTIDIIESLKVFLGQFAVIDQRRFSDRFIQDYKEVLSQKKANPPKLGQRVSLPTYSFAKHRYWIEKGRTNTFQYKEVSNISYYHPIWESRTLSELKKPKGIYEEGISWVFIDKYDHSNLGSQLSSQENIIWIKRGEHSSYIGSNSYTLKAGCEKSIQSFLTEMDEKDCLPQTVFFLWGLDIPKAVTLKNLKSSSDTTINTVVSLIHTFTKKRHTDYLFTYIYSGLLPHENPLHWTLSGFSKSLNIELPQSSLKLFHIDNVSKLNSLMLEKESREGKNELHISYQNDQRLVYNIAEYSTKTSSDQDYAINRAKIKQKGTYVITGGLGGLGKILSAYLIEKYKVNIILLGRSKVTPDKQSFLDSLRHHGISVTYYSVDITELDSVIHLFSHLKNEKVSLNGVFHLAGLINSLKVQDDSLTNFKSLIRPKITGTLVLSELQKKSWFDQLFLFSSISALGFEGSSSYAAANAFLDSFSNSFSNQCQFVSSINWPYVINGGMNLVEGVGEQLLNLKGMNTLKDEAFLHAFEASLKLGLPQVIVNEGDKEKFLQTLSTPIKSNSSNNDFTNMRFLSHQELMLRVKLWISDSLDIDENEIEGNKSFLSYGMDSIMSMRIVYKLRAEWSDQVSMSALFDYPTLDKLSRYLKNFETDNNSINEAEPKPSKLIENINYMPLIKKGVGRPIFVLPALWGNSFLYRNLLDGVTDRPIYGGYCLGASGEAEPYSRLKTIASFFVEQILKIQKVGPFDLMGYSFGGMIAYEIAQQLKVDGYCVGFLGLIDTYSDWRPLPLSLGLKAISPKMSISQDKITGLSRDKFVNLVKTMPSNLVPDFFGSDSLRVYEANQRALIAYQPTQYLGNNRIYLFDAQKNNPENFPNSKKNWLALTNACLTTVPISGDHFQCIQKEYTIHWKDKLSELLLEAEKNSTFELNLSPNQLALFSYQKKNPQSYAYNGPICFRLPFKLNISLWEQACKHFVEQHPILKTRIRLNEENLPVQLYNAMSSIELELSDLRGKEFSDREIKQLIVENLQQPFNIEGDSLCRFHLYQVDEENWIFSIVVHHIIFDGQSISSLQGIFEIYQQLILEKTPREKEKDTSYFDHIVWQKEFLESETYIEQLSYWREALQGYSFSISLPFDKNLEKDSGDFGGSESFYLDACDVDSLSSIAIEYNTTLFTLLLSAYGVLLSKYSEQKDILIGSPSLGRKKIEENYGIGYFANLLPLTCSISKSETFLSLLEKMKNIVKKGIENQDIPFAKLIQDLNLPQIESVSTPIQAVFEILSTEESVLSEKYHKQYSSFVVNGYSVPFHEGLFPLSLIIVPDENGRFKLLWKYQLKCFKDDKIKRFARSYKKIIQQIINNIHTPVSEISILSKAERKTILVDWNQTEIHSRKEQGLHQFFEVQATKTPQATAVKIYDQSVTYAELNAKAEHLARYLQKKGVKPQDFVGICVEKSIDMIIAMIGILKSGAAFIPLDPTYPEDRLSYMVEDSGLSVLLTHKTLNIDIPIVKETIYLDLDWHKIRQTEQKLNGDFCSSQLAYIIYTSGSTGKPKGVMIEHKSVLNTLFSLIRIFNICEKDNIGQCSSYSFDAAIYDIFSSLLSGACLVLVPRKEQLDTEKFIDYINKNQVSSILLTPSFIKSLNNARIPSLKKIISGSERANSNDLSYYLKYHNVYNVYGPTECTIISTTFQMKREMEAIPIGKAIDNTRLYILDEQLEPVPIGVAGELYISGEGLARGYLNQPELTNQLFISNPFIDSSDPNQVAYSRMYKTGDLCKYQEDGNVEWLDRIGSQVKLRGYRIELGEIEENIKQYEGIKDAVVIAQGSDENKRLVVFYLSDRKLPLEELNSFLANKLPSFMIPSLWERLDYFPFTSSGKIARSILQQKQVTSTSIENYLKPQTFIEEKIHQIWREVLPLEKIGIHDSFFDAGGNSLSIIKVSHLLKKHGFNVDVTDLLSHATINKLASFISSQGNLRLSQLNKSTAMTESPTPDQEKEIEIAIIGMSCRLPKANDVTTFWENLKSGQEGIYFFDEQELQADGVPEFIYQNPNYVRAKGWLEGVEDFDANFFGYSEHEASMIDPQHRLFLELSYQALEDASYNLDNQSRHIGVYGGCSKNMYEQEHLNPHFQDKGLTLQEDLAFSYQSLIANASDFLCSRITYKLNLTGPAVVVQTACSTSAAAIDKACQDIREGRCELALAGGVSLLGGFGKQGYMYQEGMILSSDGHCRPFDKEAKGTVISQGGGMILLKPLSTALKDGDNIYAVIRGSAMQNDGSDKVSFTAPSVNGQHRAIELAIKNSGLSTDQISYVEAHGTGTALGDPLEIKALNAAFRRLAKQDLSANSCALGSVKSNLGHTDAAAGVVSVIKTALCLKYQSLVPTLHYKVPNPNIDFSASPFYVNTRLRHWESDNGTLRRASVNSTGIGGSNVHLILEEAPKNSRKTSKSLRSYHLFPFSAKSANSLLLQLSAFDEHLSQQQIIEVADLAFSLRVGRNSFNHRKIIQAQSLESLREQLELAQRPSQSFSTLSQPKVIFMFSGQGSQYVDMAQYFYIHEPAFKKALDYCISLLRSTEGIDLKSVLYPNSGQQNSELIHQTKLSQPVLFSVEYSLAKLWESYGVTPDFMIGHSVGEYVAACLAGVFSLESALQIVSRRGALMQSLPKGDMLSIELCERQTKHLLDNVSLSQSSEVDIAVLNHHSKTVVAGTVQSISKLKEYCEKNEIRSLILQTSHAFHSFMMEPILKEFESVIEKHVLNEPSIPYISNVSGNWIEKKQACSPNYWSKHLRSEVRYHDGISTLVRKLHDGKHGGIFIEVGPGQVLKSLTNLHPEIRSNDRILSTTGHHLDSNSDEKTFSESLGLIWEAGCNVQLENVYQTEHRTLIRGLPSYVFEKKKCWIKNQSNKEKNKNEASIKQQEYKTKQNKGNALSLEKIKLTTYNIWNSRFSVNLDELKEKDFFTLGGDSLMAVSLIGEINQTLSIEVPTQQLVKTPNFYAFVEAIHKMIVIDEINYSYQSKNKRLINKSSKNREFIVPLSKNKADKVLYLIHPIGGEVYFYKPLADALGDSVEVYGIRSVQHSATQEYTIEEMARCYQKEINQHRDGKPYHLGGSSLGGLIAFEIAQQALNKSEKINPVLMIDTPFPDDLPEPHNTCDHVLYYLFGDQVELDLSLLEKLSKLESKLDYISCLFASSGRKSNFSINITQDLIDSWLTQSKALFQYRPKFFSGEVYYVGHKESKMGYPDGSHQSWEKLISEFNYSHTSGGNHITMNNFPYSEEIADVIKYYTNKGLCSTAHQTLSLDCS